MSITAGLFSHWHKGLALLWALCIPSLGLAQAQGSGAHLTGVVYDSLNLRPLSGADVHLRRLGGLADSANAELTVLTNERGDFDFGDIAVGSYVLGFFHVSLDSLGVVMPMSQVEVRSGSPINIDLAVPSHEGIIALVCGRNSISDTTGLLIGVVRTAESAVPAQPSVVALQWDELVIGSGGLRGETQGITTPTRSDGWYAFCNVHVNSAMQLRAARGADTSGAIGADLVARQVVRRDIYVGPGTRVARDSAVVWRGPAQLAGEVRASNGRAISGASVSLMRGDRVQIERRKAAVPSDLLQMIPRVEVAHAGTGWFGKRIAFRSAFGKGYCRPDLYVDGVLFRAGDMEIDEIVNPDHVEAIEVYTRPGVAPLQFTNNMSGCGSIVVWLRK